MPEVDHYRSGTFGEALRFFRRKVNLPTKRWDDLWQGMHSRAFVIAGATKEELLSDIRGSIEKAIAEGTTLATFRKEFDQTVQRHGWSYKGSRGWRTRVILNTNLRTAYAAGRYKQQQELKQRLPLLMYRHGDTRNPRPEHLAWDGLVLPADDPFWDTHNPPNGWGCQCKTFAVGKRDLDALGKSGPDKAPEITDAVDKNGVPLEPRRPAGIDLGWNYNVGQAAWGRKPAEVLAKKLDDGDFEELGVKGPADFGRPDAVPVDAARAALGPEARGRNDLRPLLNAALGGDEAYYTDPFGDVVNVGMGLLDHLLESAKRLDGRERYFPIIREVVEDPFEVWASFVRNTATGQVLIRRRYVKMIRVGKAKSVGLVADAVGSRWVGLTLFRGGKSNLKNSRKGMLVWGR